MKSVLAFVLLFVFSSVVFAQNIKTRTGFSVYIDSLGNVSDTNLRVIEKYDTNNNCIEVREIVKFKENTNYTLKRYDSQGRLIEIKKSYFNDRVVEIEKLGYDENGYISWKSNKRGTRYNKYYAVNKFDMEGNLERTTFYSNDSTEYSYIVYAFKDGKVKEKNFFEYPNYLLSSKSYTYDGDRILTFKEYNSKLRKILLNEYLYNQNGDLISIKTSDKGETIYAISMIYNSEGLEVKEVKKYIASKEILETFYTYEFWEK